MKLDSTLDAIAKSLHLTLCLKVFHPTLAAGTALGETRQYFSHETPFCQGVKRTLGARCNQCDLRDVPTLCSQKKTLFIHTCHAGASELIVPVFQGDTLIAVAYLGQFRTEKKQPLQLPHFDAATRRHCFAMARALRSFLAEGLQSPTALRETSGKFRREAIARYLRSRLRKNPTLTDLARHLHLSVGRAGHAVREATGSSFVELRDTFRLNHAKSLLQGTYYKVGHIATECGFSSPEYFHRFFRLATGLTPLAFRKQHRTEA